MQICTYFGCLCLLRAKVVAYHLFSLYSTDICGKTFKHISHRNRHQQISHSTRGESVKIILLEISLYIRIKIFLTHNRFHRLESTVPAGFCDQLPSGGSRSLNPARPLKQEYILSQSQSKCGFFCIKSKDRWV